MTQKFCCCAQRTLMWFEYILYSLNFHQNADQFLDKLRLFFFLPSYLKPDRKGAFFLPGFGQEGRKIGKKFRRKVENNNFFFPNVHARNDFLQKTIGKSRQDVPTGFFLLGLFPCKQWPKVVTLLLPMEYAFLCRFFCLAFF